MIGINPCGMAVDWGRRPYTTTARVFNTPDSPTVLIRWYVTDQPFQEFPSFVNSLDWDEEPHRPRTLGEVYGTPRRYNGLWRMPGLPGDHQCGEPAQFLEGVPYDPDREPVALDRDWIPTCCNRRPVGEALVGIFGGGELNPAPLYVGSAMVGVNAGGSMRRFVFESGSAVVGITAAGEFQRITTEEGSAVVGVTAAGEFQRITTEEGSAVVGVTAAGELEVVTAFAPGVDCSTATELEVGVLYTYNLPTSVFDQQWWQWTVANGTYHLTTTGMGTAPFTSKGQHTEAATCGGPMDFGPVGTGCTTVTVTAGILRLKVVDVAESGDEYTFQLDTGACP